MTAAIEELPSSEPSAAPGVNGSDADDAELAAREAAWVEELSAAEEWDAEVARLVKAEQVAEGIDEDFDDHSPKDWQRFYMGYHQRFVDDCVLELRGGTLQIRLAQAPSASVAAKQAAKGGGGGGRAGGGAAGAASGSGKGGGKVGGKAGGKPQSQPQQQDLDKASDPALTGTTVWDGAVVLAHYLTETPVLAAPPPAVAAATADGSSSSGVDGGGAAAAGSSRLWPCSGAALPSVLELGAGTGGVSLALAATRTAASVTATDLPDLLPTLRLNAGRNSAVLPPGGRLHVAPLKWGPEGEADVQALGPVRPPYDVICGSDLIYYSYTPDTPHTALLLWTLRRLVAPTTRVYLSLSLHHNPEEVEHFLGWAAQDFHVLRLRRSVPEHFRVPDSLVVRLTPRRAKLVQRRQQAERERREAEARERREAAAREAEAREAGAA